MGGAVEERACSDVSDARWRRRVMMVNEKMMREEAENPFAACFRDSECGVQEQGVA